MLEWTKERTGQCDAEFKASAGRAGSRLPRAFRSLGRPAAVSEGVRCLPIQAGQLGRYSNIVALRRRRRSPVNLVPLRPSRPLRGIELRARLDDGGIPEVDLLRLIEHPISRSEVADQDRSAGGRD